MTTPTIDMARSYLDGGWPAIPLPAGRKWPPPPGVTGWRGRYTTHADLTRPGWDWSGNVGLRLPPDVIGIDVDVYHGGDASLAGLETELGPLPPTAWSTSRSDGSGIALFRVPYGTTLRTDPAEGIDVVQYHHRYVVCAPSVHPDTGNTYRWIDEQGDEELDGPGDIGELPELPWTWIEALRSAGQPGAAAAAPEEADAFLGRHVANERPQVLGVLRRKLAETKPGGRHDALIATACWAMREAAAGYYSATEAVSMLHDWWIGAVADDPRRREGGEFGEAILWAIAQAEAEPERVETLRQRDRTPPAGVDPETGEIRRAELGDEFWTARPALGRIRQAARSRLVAPSAVLGAVLARVAAFTPPSTCLPALVGSRQPLSLFTALQGNSGAGKSSPEAAAADLLPVTPPGCVGPLALGSGEGLVEAFMELVEEVDDNGKRRKVKRQVHHGALFSLDEGQLLAELGARKGATIMPVLRTAWSGGDPGQANAAIETRRSLPRGSYAVGLISLWQDFAAAALLDDQAGGTPQRFVWFDTLDPAAPDEIPPWPGGLDWSPPAKTTIAAPMALHPDIEAEVRSARRSVLRGVAMSAPLDSHRTLNRLKVAGVLAVLDGRRDVGLEDWRLAGIIMDASDTVRGRVCASAARHASEQQRASDLRAARRESTIADAHEVRALASAARSVANRVWKGNGEPVGRRHIARAIGSKYRAVVSVDDAIEEAERLEWIDVAGDGSWRPGRSRPA